MKSKKFWLSQSFKVTAQNLMKLYRTNLCRTYVIIEVKQMIEKSWCGPIWFETCKRFKIQQDFQKLRKKNQYQNSHSEQKQSVILYFEMKSHEICF